MNAKIIYLIATTCFAACTQMEDFDLKMEKENASYAQSSLGLSTDDALELANTILEKSHKTRNADNSEPVFDYIIIDRMTRAQSEGKDTIAYVINYGSDSGFVVMATDGRPQPILAFSDTGHFNKENENCKVNFINRIHDYLVSTAGIQRANHIEPGDLEVGEIVKPFIKINLWQGLPWTKYVEEKYAVTYDTPGSMLVAMTLAMTHAKDSVKYHGKTYYNKQILQAIKNGPQKIVSNSDLKTIGGIIKPDIPDIPLDSVYIADRIIMSYDDAVDCIATMMKYIADDFFAEVVGANNQQFLANACSVIKCIGYQVPSGTVTYDIVRVADYLKNNHIICLHSLSGDYGYCWVADGLKKIMMSTDEDDPSNYYIHCDWGNNGECNGYYTGRIFSIDQGLVWVQKYFAVKLENKQ